MELTERDVNSFDGAGDITDGGLTVRGILRVETGGTCSTCKPVVSTRGLAGGPGFHLSPYLGPQCPQCRPLWTGLWIARLRPEQATLNLLWVRGNPSNDCRMLPRCPATKKLSHMMSHVISRGLSFSGLRNRRILTLVDTGTRSSVVPARW